MYKLIAFDLDGTILNTLDDLCDSVNVVLEEFHFPKRTLDEVRRFVGNGVLKLIERAVPSNTSEDIILQVFNRFSEYYLTHSSIKTKPYDGVIQLLQKLRRIMYIFLYKVFCIIYKQKSKNILLIYIWRLIFKFLEEKGFLQRRSLPYRAVICCFMVT
mgnify:CR=1 FL=1